MNRSFLQRLEQAFAEACDLNDQAAQSEFCRRIAEEDAALADELRMMLAIRDEADELFAPQRDHFSLLLASLGDTKRTESGKELLEFLSGVSESQCEDELASIHGFSLHELVAIGATGFVFRGVDKSLQRDVAIKVLAPSIARDPIRRQVFTQEARLASTVRHTNVVPIYHVSDDKDSTLVFYVMDWVEGVLLQELITSTPPDQPQVAKLLRQLGDGVDAIHAGGIVHRDLKPGNMIVGPSGHLTIVDFGLALEHKSTSETSAPAGTPLYMSPEQLEGKQLSHRSDLFSLAEIACVLLCEAHPYPARSIGELSELVLNGEPRITTDNAGLACALSRGLSKDPDERFENATSFVDACLASLGRSRSGAASRTVASPNVRSSWSRRIVALCAVTAVSIAMIVRWTNSNVEESTGQTTPLGSEITKGMWLDKDHYRNYVGMDFIRISGPSDTITSWPPAADHPELFENLGWANHRKDIIIGSRLITSDQYADVMDLPLAAVSDSADEPVTMVSMLDAERFCKRLSDSDPDGNTYGVCSANAWTLATYGSALLEGRTNTSEIMSVFESFSGGNRLDKSSTNALSLIEDTGGHYWEWTRNTFRKPTTVEGIVPYTTLAEQTGEPIYQALGGATRDIFLHAHHMRFGMNDHFHSSENLKFHTEEDGETSYLHPIQHNERAYLRYRYSDLASVIGARVRVPFSLFNKESSAGIRIRSTSTPDQQIDGSEWKDVYTCDASHADATKIELVDVTAHIRNATEVELEYWLIANDGAPENYTQLGRTSVHSKIPEVFCFEAIAHARNESPRQFVPLPASHKSSHVGFRIQLAVSE